MKFGSPRRFAARDDDPTKPQSPKTLSLVVYSEKANSAESLLVFAFGKQPAEQDRILANKIGTYTQYPLMLAWAVTIHKSQGKSLDNALLDFGHGTFENGQVYVALSRCRSIEGIWLDREIKETDIKCDPIIKRFYEYLENQ